MRVLIVDTAGTRGGVLLAQNESASLDVDATEVLGKRQLEPREFSRQLIPSIAELLHAGQMELTAVDAFAVVSGPGSFTGLRVGLSAVKAMAEVTAKPIVAISRLAVMAAVSSAPELSVHAVLDAGRGEFFHGMYRDAGRTRVGESLETAATLVDSLKKNQGPVLVSEPAVADRIVLFAGSRLQLIPEMTVREALPLVLTAWREKNFMDAAALDANYLRRIEPVSLPSTPSQLRTSQTGI